MKRYHFKYYLSGIVSILTFAVYLPSLQNNFLQWDDILYVLDNQHITSMNADFFRWAFFDFYASNWHPLTWISHALDYFIWGLNPMGHHLTNVILHSINTFLVILLTTKLIEVSKETAAKGGLSVFQDDLGALIAGGITGLLFGLHPLHVESVAWVAERKDLLCAFFFLLSIIIYTKYAMVVENKRTQNNYVLRFLNRRYLVTIGIFILALLSKPMAVSLPLVLLILDFYPFRRIQSLGTFKPAFVEKLPFILLSLISSLLTIFAQKGAIESADILPLSTRVLVAMNALIAYIWKMILPFNLSPIYPYPQNVFLLSIRYLLPTALVIAVTTIFIIIAKKKQLWLSVWGYYVVTLFPVIGIVQVGSQSMADRYTYLPSLGPFLVIGLGAAWVAGKLNRLEGWGFIVKSAYAALGILAFAFISYSTVKQIGIWKNCIIFWNHVIEKEPTRIPVAYNNRGACLSEIGQFDKAIEDFDKAIAINSSYSLAYNNRGKIFLQRGMVDWAIKDFDKAIALNPSFSIAYNNRAMAFSKMGQLDKAMVDYDKAIALNPSFQIAYYNRGLVHFRGHNKELTISDFQKACALGSEVGCKALQDLESMGKD